MIDNSLIWLRLYFARWLGFSTSPINPRETPRQYAKVAWDIFCANLFSLTLSITYCSIGVFILYNLNFKINKMTKHFAHICMCIIFAKKIEVKWTV